MKPSTYFWFAALAVGAVGAVRLWNRDFDGVLFLGSAFAHFIASVIFTTEEIDARRKAARKGAS